jgi:uridine phosphorylase
MMMMMVNDSNGARIVLGPIFSHYEFYADQASFEAVGSGRFTDEDWQNNYDGLT